MTEWPFISHQRKLCKFNFVDLIDHKGDRQD